MMMLVTPSMIMEMATPERRSWVILMRPRTLEIRYTKIIVTAAPRKALMERE